MSAIPYYDKDFAKLSELITPYQALLTDHSGRTSDLKESHISLEYASGFHLDDMRGRMEVSVNDLTQLVTHPDGSVNGSNRSSWSYLCLSDLWNPLSESGVKIVDGRRSYNQLKERYHELMIGLLHLSAFEVTELWLVDESRTDRMTIVAAFHTDACLQPWAAFTRLLSLSSGTDVPGIVLQTGRPVVDQSYGEHDKFDVAYPRALHAAGLGLQVAMGVPLPSGGDFGVCGALVFYSRKSFIVDPTIMTMVSAAAYLLAGSAPAPTPAAPNRKEKSELMADVDISVSDSPIGVKEEPMHSVYTNPVVSCLSPEDTDQSTIPTDIGDGDMEFPGQQAIEGDPHYEEDSKSLIDFAFSNALEFFCNEFDGSWPDEEHAEGQLTEPISSFPDGGRKRTRTMSRNNSFTGITAEGEAAAHLVGAESVCRRCSRQLMRGQVGMLCTNCAHVTGASGTHGQLALMPLDAMPMYPQLGNPTQAHSMSMKFAANSWGGSPPGSIWNKGEFFPEDFDAIDPAIFARMPRADETAFDMSNFYPHLDKASMESSGAIDNGKKTSSKSSSSTKTIKICKFTDCENTTMQRSPYCAAHAGSRKCHHEGCTKCAQGSTKFCIAHGGGRRCTHPGCTKGARDRFFCAAHGGGKRCSAEGCHKSAVGSSKFCTNHGGGKRCKEPGCQKSAQSSTQYCVRHGGGRKCIVEGCKRVSRGKTNYCASHGGGGTSGSEMGGGDNDEYNEYSAAGSGDF